MFCADLRLLFHIHVNFVVKKKIFCIYFFHYIYSMKDLEFYINRKIEIIIEMCTFYTENVRFNGKEQHIIHLHILLGKLHIHKKWAQCRPNIHFIND